MGELPRGLYTGSAKNRLRPGEEPSLELAILDAYEQGMQAKRDAGGDSTTTYHYRVEAIFIEGTNPPSDYKVFLSDNGHS